MKNKPKEPISIRIDIDLKMKKIVIGFLVLFLFISFFHGEKVWADTEWRVLTSKFVLIKFKTNEDIEMLSKKLRFNLTKESIMNLFFGRIKVNHTEQLTAKVDGIFERVKELLGMQKKRGMGVTIEIYLNQEELDKAYQRVLGKKKSEVAFYVSSTNTIYLSLDQVSEGILSHEIAHCVIYLYCLIPPPPEHRKYWLNTWNSTSKTKRTYLFNFTFFIVNFKYKTPVFSFGLDGYYFSKFSNISTILPFNSGKSFITVPQTTSISTPKYS